MKFLVGQVHGVISYLIMKDETLHYPDYNPKKKKYIWQPTLVCPKRLATFEECETLEPEEAFMEMKHEVDVRVGRK